MRACGNTSRPILKRTVMPQSVSDEYLRGEVAQDLDFYRLREEIASLCVSAEGRALLLAREPSSCAQDIERLKTAAREWTAARSAKNQQRGACTLTGWEEVRASFALLTVSGASLSKEELIAIGGFCRAVEKAQKLSFVFKSVQGDLLCAMAEQLPVLDVPLKKIGALIDFETGNVKDVPALRAVKERIFSLQKEVEGAIKKYTGNTFYATALQSTVPVYRTGRELLAVRSDHRAEIKGIIHEVSGTGQTVYIEPEELVKANNDLVRAEYELTAELNKLFKTLTEEIAPYTHDLSSALDTMLFFDVTQASSLWQEKIHGVFAEPCAEGEPLTIVGARHPLLKEKAVPIDIRFAEGKRTLIITGANTGGKTVTLKTIALFALLNQAGFPLPAQEGTRLPLFSSIFADIGDEQSIDESLSTFSSHMKKLSCMLQKANAASLLLLDEFASGTDPQEGAAIAMASLDALIEKNALIIVTTHQGILKNYGYTHPQCINASVEFDATTLLPTYRLLMGVPGESHAIEIAKTSGMPEPILQKARAYIATEKADISALIKGLSQKHVELDKLLLEQQEKLQRLTEKEIALQQAELRIREAELALRERELAQSSAFLRETRSKLENLVRQLREGEITRQKTLSVRSFINDFTQEVAQQETDIAAAQEALLQKKSVYEECIAQNGMRISPLVAHGKNLNKKTRRRLSNKEALKTAQVQDVSQVSPYNAPGAKTQLTAGMQVLAGKEKRHGTLLQKNKDGTWQVLFGSVKMNVKESLLSPAGGTLQRKASFEIETDFSSKDDIPLFELRLLGMREEDALKALEHQLDLCMVSHFESFSIIHGKGSGILQQAVHDYLSHYPGVKSFSYAPPEDGGTGKTYVTLF